jgi:toluene monooxygenase electron transfer component
MKVTVRAKNGTREFACGAGEKILHAGLRHGVELPYECATGTCGTCKARLVGGQTASDWPGAPGTRYLKHEAELLTCQSVAREDCAIEVAGPLRSPEPNASRPGVFAGELRGWRRLTHDVAAFEVELDAPLDFAAGQFALLTVPGIAGARAYSMVTFERATARLSFVVKKKPGGAVSEWLFGDGIQGARLGVVAPLGRATFQADLARHLLCVAGGSGIAGMMSILSHACRAGHFAAWDGHVFFGVRTARDTFFLDELERVRSRYPARLAVTVALSDEDVPAALRAAHPGLAFARGLVHAVAGERMKGRYADVRAYVAGPPPMVDATLRLLLREARLPATEIRYDKFS